MIKLNKLKSNKNISILRRNYYDTLELPMEGFWAKVIIGKSNCYEILYNEDVTGHCSIDAEKTIVQFYVEDKYLKYGKEIFEYIVSTDMVQYAYVSTIEPFFLSLCLDYQKSVEQEAYLFYENIAIKNQINNFDQISFTLAEEKNLEVVKEKCGLPFEGYYEELIANDNLFVAYDKNTFLGIGEYRKSTTKDGYSDIGMVVEEEHRQKGIGTYILSKLKEHCIQNNETPIVACDYKNTASRKTIEKSGFISKHRIIRITFLDVEHQKHH